MAGEMRWIRSYFFQEEDGTRGTICVYEAESADAIREHARRALLLADGSSDHRDDRQACRSGARDTLILGTA
jgi:hypothetical protein